MLQTLINAFKTKEVRNKILMTLLFVFIYRIGCFIPVPGIDAAAVRDVISGNDFLGIMSAVTGGALQNGTLFAIGISPYINSSIIMQLLTVALPSLERLSKQGEEGKKKITQITRYVTIGFAVVNALGILFAFRNSDILNLTPFGGAFPVPEWVIFIFVALIFTAGSSLCMWIGERITEYGVSNGISMLIFSGIIASASNAILAAIKSVSGTGFNNGGWELLIFLVLLTFIFAFIVFVDGGERKIPVQYAKQVKGNRMYGGQSTHIPVKVNGSGVLPLIFAFALLSFPQMIFSTFFPTSGVAIWWQQWLGAGTWIYNIILALAILGFAFFYSQIQFNPVDISKNIQQNGGFIPGIRPGKATSDYIAKIVARITFFGALFLAFIALVPSMIFTLVGASDIGLLNAFSATGMLIVVSVALEFDKALENLIMMRYYKGFLK